MIFFRGVTIGVTRRFGCFEISEPDSLSFKINICSPKFYAPYKAATDALISRGRVYAKLSVITVLFNRGFSDIFKFIITTIPIFMIYICFWPFFGHIQPRETRDEIAPSVDSDLRSITVAPCRTALQFFTLNFRDIFSFFPSENSSFWVVIQNGAQIFRRDVGKLISSGIFFHYADYTVHKSASTLERFAYCGYNKLITQGVI